MPESLFHLRPFGRAEDLDLEFERADRPALVTALLERCSAAGDPAAWWTQPIGNRIAALLRIVALSEDSSELTVRLRCPRPCGESFEVALPIDALGGNGAVTDPIPVTLAEGAVVAVRRPTGEDQRGWRSRGYSSQREATRAMIDTLVVDGHVTPDDESALAALSEALAEHDPLVAFTVSCACPACRVTSELAIDLEGIALERLAARQRALIQDVHVLALRYGWTEREILAIPPARRARYRSLTDEVAG